MINLKRLLKSFKYACKGLLKVFQEEQNIQIQAMVAFLIIVLGFIYEIKLFEWAIIVLTISTVFLMEILNSAVERVSDILKPRISAYVKDIKDIMAAAVFLASVFAVIIGILIFYPYLFA